MFKKDQNLPDTSKFLLPSFLSAALAISESLGEKNFLKRIKMGKSVFILDQDSHSNIFLCVGVCSKTFTKKVEKLSRKLIFILIAYLNDNFLNKITNFEISAIGNKEFSDGLTEIIDQWSHLNFPEFDCLIESLNSNNSCLFRAISLTKSSKKEITS
jgi:hypothetical protein